MDKLKLSQRVKKIALTVLSACALVFTAIGTTLIGATADTLPNIVAPEQGFTRVARYEFNDPNNLGLDSWGNNHLVNNGKATADTTNRSVKLGETNSGYLYAPTTDGKDFSDLMKGSFSLSFRTYIKGDDGAINYYMGTGWDTAYAFDILQNWNDFTFKLSNGQTITYDCNIIYSGGYAGWYRVNVIYDANASTLRFAISGRNSNTISFDQTKNVTSAITFGGARSGVFTLGGRSTGAIGGFVGATGFGQNLSDFRIYAGAIDEAEITKILTEDSGLADITAPETGFNKVAHYEFDDAKNLGKDSLGNFPLVNNGKATANTAESSAVIGESNSGYLYAPAIGSNNKDFSDLIKGSFSLSFRMYVKGDDGAVNYYMGTSWDAESSFAILQDWNKLTIKLSNGQSLSYSPGIIYSGGSKGWFRINVIYDATAGTLRVTSTGRNNNTNSFDQTQNVTSAITFGGAANGVFTLGGRSSGARGGFAGATGFDQTLSDFRIYSGAIDNAEIAAITKYDEDEASKKTLAANSEVSGASIRLVGDPGLRFLATINESMVNSFVEKYGAENVGFGMRVIRNHNGNLAYAYVSATNNTLKDGVYSFNAVITGMTSEYYETEYTAQVYISYTVDGETTYIVSDSTTESKTRSISYVANAALNDTYTVDVNGTLEDKSEDYKYEIAEGVWSPYSTSLREKLSVYAGE